MSAQTSTPARNTKVMNRFDLTSRLVAKLKNEEAVIGGIGNTNFDLWAAGNRPQNWYMLGSMGLAFPIALGVALAQPKRRVFALEGDGSLLMQLGCLSTIATLAPKNLCMVVMDNGVYQITGAQPTPGATVADIVAKAGVARDVFYEHFTDKQHAFLEAQQHPVQHIVDTCASAYFSVPDWPERVWNGLDSLLKLIASAPSMSWFCGPSM